MALRALPFVLLYAAAAEPMAIETSVLLQSSVETVPGEDAVNLQVSDGGIGEISEEDLGELFALPEDVGNFISTRNATAKKDEAELDTDKLLEMDHRAELIDLTHSIAHDFNAFYRLSQESTQWLVERFQLHRMDIAKVKQWMQYTYKYAKKFLVSAHQHMLTVVEDAVKAAEGDEAEADSFEGSWSLVEANKSAEWAMWLTNVMQRIENPLIETLAILKGATTDLVNATNHQFCHKAVPALQCLVNISTVLREDVAPLVELIMEHVERVDKVEREENPISTELAATSTTMSAMFFKSVESWVEYVNATVGGTMAVAFGCPVTHRPRIATPRLVRGVLDAAVDGLAE